MIKIKNNNMLSQFYYLKNFFFIYNLNFNFDYFTFYDYFINNNIIKNYN